MSSTHGYAGRGMLHSRYGRGQDRKPWPRKVDWRRIIKGPKRLSVLRSRATANCYLSPRRPADLGSKSDFWGLQMLNRRDQRLSQRVWLPSLKRFKSQLVKNWSVEVLSTSLISLLTRWYRFLTVLLNLQPCAFGPCSRFIPKDVTLILQLNSFQRRNGNQKFPTELRRK